MKLAEDHPGTFGQPGVLVMGTGPWEVDGLDPISGAELSANPNWWGRRVPVQHISIKFFSNDTSLALAFRASELDVDVLVLGPKAFRAASGATIESAPSCLDGFFYMNTQVAPWDNVHVRQAVAYALNRSDIIVANGGYAQPDYTLIPDLALRTVGSQAQINALLGSLPLYDYNPAEAKAELAESPYPHWFSSTLLEFSYGSVINISQVVAAELDKVGIDAQIKEVSLPAWSAAFAAPVAERPSGFSTSGCLGPDVSGYDHLLGSYNIPDGDNIAEYGPPAVDKLLTAGISTGNKARRFAIYSALLRRLATDEPYVPPYTDEYSIGLSHSFTVPDFPAEQLAWQFGDYALLVKPTS